MKKCSDGPVCVSIGDKVDVFWEYETEWFAGQVIDVDDNDCTYEVHYFLDDKKFWHDTEWNVRHSESRFLVYSRSR